MCEMWNVCHQKAGEHELTYTHTHTLIQLHTCIQMPAAAACIYKFLDNFASNLQIIILFFFFANGIFSKLADHSEIMKTHLLFGVFSTLARWNRYFSDINVICANANLHFAKIFAYYFLYFTSSISIYANIRFFVCVSNYLLHLRYFVFQQILTPKVFSSFLY